MRRNPLGASLVAANSTTRAARAAQRLGGTRRGRVATAPTTSTAKAAAASRALVWSKLGWPITPASPATVAVSVVQESATNLTTSIGRVGTRDGVVGARRNSHQAPNSAAGMATVQALVQRWGDDRSATSTSAAARNASPTGWEATETVSNIAAVTSPRRSRRSSAISTPSPDAKASNDGMRSGVSTVSQPEPKKSSRIVGGSASQLPTRRRAITKKRPPQSRTRVVTTSRYGRSAPRPKTLNIAS